MRRVTFWLRNRAAHIAQRALPAPLLAISEQNVLLGGMLGGALLMLLGAVLGASNRGLAGAVVGGLSAGIAGTLLGGLVGSLATTRQAEVQAEFDLEEHPGGYGPGDVVGGYVVLRPSRSGRTHGGKVLLVCRGFYAYDEQGDDEAGEPRVVRNAWTYHVQEANVIPSGTVRRGAPVRFPFRLELPPEALPTHHGFGCAVRWSLHAELEGVNGAAGAGQEVFVRAACPLGVGARPERASVTSSGAELVLTLPRTAYGEGETLQGRVIVNPVEDTSASEVRVLLLRVEHNPRGPDHIVYINGWNAETGRFRGESRPGGTGTTYVWLEDEADLAENIRLAQGEKRLFDFAFQIPQQWRPTVHTEHGDVSWRVVAVLSRPNGRDLRVQLPITVHTGAPHIARVMASPAGLEDAAGTF